MKMKAENTDEWNEDKHIKREINFVFLKDLIKFLVMLIKRQRGKILSVIPGI